MFNIIEVDGIIRSCICKNNKADKYGEPKNFKTRKDAEKWIEKHSYKGMSFKYEIKKV
jgi:hypothetical protein